MEKTLGTVVAGHICLDIIPDMQALPPSGFKETFLPGHLLKVGAAALCTVGPVSQRAFPPEAVERGVQAIRKVVEDKIVHFLASHNHTADYLKE
jgi:hypothetical protein